MQVDKKILFLMDLPAPVHGMSNVNQAVFQVSKVQKLSVAILNTVPSYAAKFFGSRFWGGVKLMHTIVCWVRLLFLLSFVPVSAVYRPINGGFGQVYDLVYLGICRTFGKEVYIHHHSFNYLNSKSRLFHIVNFVSGCKAIHIVLGPRMGDMLSELYGIPSDRIVVISNVAFFTTKTVDTVCHDEVGGIVIGHLANLCVAKGLEDFIDVCRSLVKRKVKFKAKIAGPFSDAGSERIVTDACNEISEIEYLGGIYGADKDNFFESIDVFVFPSKYENEAEPLVLYEAAQYGVLNVGTQRGCMQDVIGDLHGSSFPEDENLVLNLANSICEAVDTGALNEMGRKGRVDQFNLMQSQAKESLNNLMTKMAERNRDVSKT